MRIARQLAVPIPAALLCAAALGCSLGSSPAISRTQLAEQIAAGTAPVVLDVRSASEFEAGHVPGAIHIPFQSVQSRHPDLGLRKQQPIVVYCAHGPRAAWAGRALRSAGYTRVVYLDGHMAAWEEDGLPLQSPSVGAE